MVTNFKNKLHNQRLDSVEDKKLQQDLKATRTFIRNHPELIITNADKGNVTVLLNKDDYINKMEILLNDTNVYKKISRTSTTSIQNRLNEMMTTWENLGKIEHHIGKKLRDYRGNPARIYGLPKIHKAGAPLRPIVSSIGTPLYQLSSYLSNILNKTVGNTDTSIKNAEDFRTKMQNTVLPKDYVLLSLDVVSLFTNVNSTTVVKCVKKRWREIKKNANTKLTKPQFLEALELVLSSCEFTFNGQNYKQIFGSPMGSPVSPAAANLVMEYVESVVLSSFDFNIPFFFRYVDDIITAVPKDKLSMFLNKFNEFDNNIQFTMEVEVNRQLPFLDILVHHNDNGSLSFDWFHKQTWSGRYLNFNSYLPLTYKRNTISLLTEKIFKLSDNKFHKKNFKLLESTLLNNNYPIKLIKYVMKRTKNKLLYSTEISPTSPINPQNIISVPYVKDLFNRTKHLLSKYNVSVVGKSHDCLRKSVFSNLKDKLPKERQTDVIYKVSCSCGSNYVGQTKQRLGTRIQQHKSGAHNKKNKKNNPNSKRSALSQHIHDTKHNINMDNVTILERESHYRKRSILEMIHIKKCENGINKQDDSEYLHNYYDNIIK